MWLDETPSFASKITIYAEQEKLYMERTFTDGSSGNREITEKPSSYGRRFEVKTGSRSGEYFLIDSRGSLQIRDEEGLISTAKRIK